MHRVVVGPNYSPIFCRGRLDKTRAGFLGVIVAFRRDSDLIGFFVEALHETGLGFPSAVAGFGRVTPCPARRFMRAPCDRLQKPSSMLVHTFSALTETEESS